MKEFNGKVGILNAWLFNNYGALLLAYAIEKIILRLGFDVETIAWYPDARKTPLSKVKEIGIKWFILRVGNAILCLFWRNWTFRRFRQNIKRSNKKYTNKTISTISDQYDKILIGGDQAWSTRPLTYSKDFFLPWVTDRKKKICYAASIAQPDIRVEIRDEFIKNVSTFAYVTSREELTRELIKRYSDVEAPCVCDPVFLLTADEWRLLQVNDTKWTHKPFIFVYQVGIEISTIKLVKKLSMDMGIEVIYCPFPIKQNISCHRKPFISPERWLWYMDNAKYVVTDSFHGIAFSILFNTLFYVLISDTLVSTSSRLTNILDVYNLKERLVTNINEYSIKDINWVQVNKMIEDERDKSMKHLKNMLFSS